MTSVARLALDANILTLLVVGLVDKRAISKHRRLSEYDSDDFDLLVKIIASFQELIVTPGVLAETSDLLRYDRASKEATTEKLNLLLTSPDALCELYYPTVGAARRSESKWLGLVDTGLFDVVENGIPLITADFDLFQQVICRNSRCINFNLRLNTA